MTRVLVAEDSLTQRQLIEAVLSSDPEIEVIAKAANGREAVELAIRTRPDVVVMDIRMPELDGFEATKLIMASVPIPRVIISHHYDVREVTVAMQALRAGALSVLSKPADPRAADFQERSLQLVRTVKAIARIQLPAPAILPGRLAAASQPAKVIAMAASTGGPPALHRIFSELPATFNLPILLVQHISRGFCEGFAAWLNSVATIRVKVAEQGEALVGGAAYLAPDDLHLGVEAGRIRLSSEEPVKGFRPSASLLFRSVAKAFGDAGAAIVLTGMGEDGVEGLRELREARGQVIAQDKESSVFFGMPGAVIAAGLATEVLSLSAIPSRMVGMAHADREDQSNGVA
jgi:two-component system, chemotaxis family, protein-glutamate methylesterase/glutaminase